LEACLKIQLTYKKKSKTKKKLRSPSGIYTQEEVKGELAKWQDSLSWSLDFFFDGVDAGHVVADFGQTDPRDKTTVSGLDAAIFQRQVPFLRT
jgi:hypothetical protein